MVRLKYNLDEISTMFIEPGRYKAKLVKVEQTTSTSNNPMLTWHWKITGGAFKGKQIRSFTSLLETALGGLKEHLIAFSYSGKVNFDTSKLVGRTVVLVIGSQVASRGPNAGREFAAVLQVLPADAPLSGEALEELDDDELDDEEFEDEDEDETEDDGYEDDEDDEDEDYEDDEDDEEEDEDEDEEEEEEEPEPVHRRKKSPPKSKSSKPSRTKPMAKKARRRGIPF